VYWVPLAQDSDQWWNFVNTVMKLPVMVKTETVSNPRINQSSLKQKFNLNTLIKSGNFSLHHRIQNGSGAHPASYPMGTRDSFPGGKAAGA
jgi:hypothetical protein